MAKSMPRQRPGKSSQGYCTPIVFLQAVKDRLGIDAFACDLAASVENSVAAKCYTKRTNSLEQPWNLGGWNWLNPPFADIEPWVRKAHRESLLGAKTAMLLPAAVGSNWWNEWVHGKAYVLFASPRITFVGEDDPYVKDCALLLFADLAPSYACWRWIEQAKKAAA
jgi:phage N-6-adenine-methyltransferase